jgi:hypothetical protein
MAAVEGYVQSIPQVAIYISFAPVADIIFSRLTKNPHRFARGSYTHFQFANVLFGYRMINSKRCIGRIIPFTARRYYPA